MDAILVVVVVEAKASLLLSFPSLPTIKFVFKPEDNDKPIFSISIIIPASNSAEPIHKLTFIYKYVYILYAYTNIF